VTEQADWAWNEGTEVVPSSLRGFRYVKSYSDSVVLRSLTYYHEWEVGKEYTSCCKAGGRATVVRSEVDDGGCQRCVPPGVLETSPPPKSEHTLRWDFSNYACRCNVVNWFVAEPYKKRPQMQTFTIRRLVATETLKHLSPQLGCFCGFYAAYHPDGLINAPGTHDFLNQKLAVVEASGRIVLGTKGFRAEKMKIVDTFRVPLFVGDNPSILEKYPPDDVSVLLGGEDDASRSPKVF
jgi:hypothetical protein